MQTISKSFDYHYTYINAYSCIYALSVVCKFLQLHDVMPFPWWRATACKRGAWRRGAAANSSMVEIVLNSFRENKNCQMLWWRERKSRGKKNKSKIALFCKTIISIKKKITTLLPTIKLFATKHKGANRKQLGNFVEVITKLRERANWLDKWCNTIPWKK